MYIAFTDGSADIQNKYLRSGCGVVVTRARSRDTIPERWFVVSRALPGATSQIAELYAAILAIRCIHENIAYSPECFQELVIVSDSSYVVDGWNRYLVHWLRNNWRKTNGKPLANIEYWKSLIAHVRAYERCGGRVYFEKVTAHQQGQGDTLRASYYSLANEIADQLAGKASGQ